MITYRMQILIGLAAQDLRIDADTYDVDGSDTVFYDARLVEVCRVRTETILGPITQTPLESPLVVPE